MGYEKKRHQAGRAFETAGLRSTNYSFGRVTEFPSTAGALVFVVGSDSIAQEPPPHVLLFQGVASSLITDIRHVRRARGASP
jgi:hypothetical protein